MRSLTALARSMLFVVLLFVAVAGTVYGQPVRGVTISATRTTLLPGQQATVTATTRLSNGTTTTTRAATFTSSNLGIVTLSPGTSVAKNTVRAIGPGQAVITAKVASYIARLTITVSPPPPPPLDTTKVPPGDTTKVPPGDTTKVPPDTTPPVITFPINGAVGQTWQVPCGARSDGVSWPVCKLDSLTSPDAEPLLYKPNNTDSTYIQRCVWSWYSVTADTVRCWSMQKYFPNEYQQLIVNRTRATARAVQPRSERIIKLTKEGTPIAISPVPDSSPEARRRAPRPGENPDMWLLRQQKESNMALRAQAVKDGKRDFVARLDSTNAILDSAMTRNISLHAAQLALEAREQAELNRKRADCLGVAKRTKVKDETAFVMTCMSRP